MLISFVPLGWVKKKNNNKRWQLTLFLYIDINQEASVSLSFKKQKRFWEILEHGMFFLKYDLCRQWGG